MTRDATRSEDASAPGVAGHLARVIAAQAGAKAADENFPVALRLLPARYRRHLTAVYGFGVIGRPLRCRFRLGPDSLLALAVFGLGIAGLFFVRPG